MTGSVELEDSEAIRILIVRGCRHMTMGSVAYFTTSVLQCKKKAPLIRWGMTEGLFYVPCFYKKVRD